MPWFVWIYFALLSLVAITSIIDDLKSKRAWHRTLNSFASSAACPLFVLSHFGLIVLPASRMLVLLAAVGLGFEMNWATREDRQEPDHSRKVIQRAVVMAVVLYVPALALGWFSRN